MLAALQKLIQFTGLYSMFADGGDSDTIDETASTKGFYGWVNKINHLILPVLGYCIIALFLWPVFDPTGFVIWAQAIGTMVDNLWLLIFLLIPSLGVAKAVAKMRSRRNSLNINMGEFDRYDFDGRFANLDERDIDVPSSPNATIDEWRARDNGQG